MAIFYPVMEAIEFSLSAATIRAISVCSSCAARPQIEVLGVCIWFVKERVSAILFICHIFSGFIMYRVFGYTDFHLSLS